MFFFVIGETIDCVIDLFLAAVLTNRIFLRHNDSYYFIIIVYLSIILLFLKVPYCK